jgi:hypothetical protein
MLCWLGTMEKISKGLKRDVEVQRSSKAGQTKLESQSKSSCNPIWISGTVSTKIIAQITYQLCFERSLYEWKDKRINFSNGIGLISKFILSPHETSKQWGAQNLSQCCVTISWSRELCIKLSPIGARPRVRAWPSQRPGRSLPLSYTPLATKNRWGFVD